MNGEAKRNKSNCLEDLRRRILTEALEPGSYLDETEIANFYGISRPPLRELLRQLMGEGYLVLHENRGAQVAPITLKTLRNLLIAAPMIHAAIGRLAAENATKTQIAELREAQLRLRMATKDGDHEQVALADERFHSTMAEMADNEYLLPSMRRLLIDHTRIGMKFYGRRDPAIKDLQKIAIEQHDQLIALIEDGKAEACAELAVAHWELGRALIESFMTPNALLPSLGRAPDIGEAMRTR
jgi:DNA-binding GntR family transcriptional regulator